MRRPLLLTGGPAVGKTTTARRLAASCDLAAAIDVDDLRQIVLAGHAAPWEGAAGRLQQRLGIENAADLARRFHGAGIDVIISDVVEDVTLPVYRRLVPDVLVVQLRSDITEAERRAALGLAHLTAQEFKDLHATQAEITAWVDHHVDVTTMGVEQQTAAVLALWT